jgi:hypothetical protein
MKITAKELRKLIRESLQEVVNEQQEEEMEFDDLDSDDSEDDDSEEMDMDDDESDEDMDDMDDMDSDMDDDESDEDMGDDEGLVMNSKEEVVEALRDVASVVQAAVDSLAALDSNVGVTDSVTTEMKEAFARISKAKSLVETSIRKERNNSAKILKDLRSVTKRSR